MYKEYLEKLTLTTHIPSKNNKSNKYINDDKLKELKLIKIFFLK